jgi:tRNA(Ile)-lysidine synthase
MTLLQQVRATNAQHSLFSPGDAVVVGVSGGPDSLTLLHSLRALRDELQITLHVAHLNHQLRGSESDADAEFVAWLAREWDLPATVEARDVGAFAREQRLSLEEAARQARYAFLAEVAQRVGARVIAVAHHADDQAETVLMHFLRGAGMAGLRGMEYKTEIRDSRFQPPIPNLQLVRPLLNVTREEIEDYCKENSLTPRFDRSNLDMTFFRNRLRQEVLPYLETLNPNIRRVLLRTSHALADDYDFLQAQVRAAYAQVAREEEDTIVFARGAWSALHPALQRGTLRAAAQQLRSDLRNIDWTHIEGARRVALEKSTGAAATLVGGLMLVVGYNAFMVGMEPRLRRGLLLPDLPLLHAERIALPVRGVVELPNSEWVVETGIASSQKETADRWTALLDLEKCSGEFFLRRRRPGDRFQPTGLRGHTQSLHEFMIDKKIPHAARSALPLLIVSERIVWVCGWRLAEGVHVTPDTRQVWRVTFRKKGNR